MPKSDLRFNIAPTQLAPVLTLHGVEQLAFGMQPDWSKSSLINAKSENLVSSRFWRPMAAFRPCLIPADGFYEPKGEKGQKRPWFGFEFQDSRPFLMAGLHSLFEREERFVIITKAANQLMEPIHSRMPVILTEHQPELISLWMDTQADLIDRVKSLQLPVEYQDLICFPVSDDAKNPRNEGVELFMNNYR